MYFGRVVGQATATVKHRSLKGAKLLLVMALRGDGSSEGDPMLAVDTLGAGWGDTVMVSSDGLGARELLGDKTSPVRGAILGIVDT